MATLTVTHTENITLEGKNMGSTKTMTFTNIADVYSRILKFRLNNETSSKTTKPMQSDWKAQAISESTLH